MTKNLSRDEIIETILKERSRQMDLPRTEFDALKTPNEWTSIVGHYLFEMATRGGDTPSEEIFLDNMTKASAVLIALIEHIPDMKENGYLK